MTVMTGTCPAVVRHRAACSSGPARVQLGPRGPRRSCTALYEAIPPGRAPAVPLCQRLWPQPGPCSGLGPLLLRVDAGPRHHRPASGHAPAASLARDPLGPGSLGTTPSHGPRAGRAAVGGGSEELRASVRDSEARLSGPTHLRMCIRVSAQAGPARSRCCGPARGPWAASGPEEAPRSSATRSGSFASSRRRMASHAHLGTTGRETSWAREVWGPRRHRGPRAGGCGQEELRDSSCDSERTGADLYISAPPGRRRRPRRHRWHRTRKRTVGPAWSSSEPEELLDSEREAAGSYVIERSSI